DTIRFRSRANLRPCAGWRWWPSTSPDVERLAQAVAALAVEGAPPRGRGAGAAAHVGDRLGQRPAARLEERAGALVLLGHHGPRVRAAHEGEGGLEQRLGHRGGAGAPGAEHVLLDAEVAGRVGALAGDEGAAGLGREQPLPQARPLGAEEVGVEAD